MSKSYLSNAQLLWLAVASAVVTANAYYIHPIIARVAADFDVAAGSIGLVPALNQMALALGIFLLLPLGDRFSNRRLVGIFVCGQFFSISVMAVAPDIRWFALGSTVLGFCTIAPYLLPAYVSHRVPPEKLGQVTAMLATGVIMGILLARTGSGVVAEYFGWRVVYYIAAILMLVMTLVLPMIMEEESPPDSGGRFSYLSLLLSMGPMIRQYPEILVSGSIQALNFGVFLATWMGLGLHLTGPEMGYGVDVVGYLALISLINLVSTPRMGRLADRMGARRARVLFAVLQALAMWLLFPFGYDIWLLMLPLLMMNLVGPPIDVAGRMLFLSQEAGIRTRLSTVYIMLMFIGGGLASWAGTAAYAWGGWSANATLAVGMTSVTVVLSLFALWQFESRS